MDRTFRLKNQLWTKGSRYGQKVTWISRWLDSGRVTDKLIISELEAKLDAWLDAMMHIKAKYHIASSQMVELVSEGAVPEPTRIPGTIDTRDVFQSYWKRKDYK
jgi:hypothetical protein